MAGEPVAFVRPELRRLRDDGIGRERARSRRGCSRGPRGGGTRRTGGRSGGPRGRFLVSFLLHTTLIANRQASPMKTSAIAAFAALLTLVVVGAASATLDDPQLPSTPVRRTSTRISATPGLEWLLKMGMVLTSTARGADEQPRDPRRHDDPRHRHRQRPHLQGDGRRLQRQPGHRRPPAAGRLDLQTSRSATPPRSRLATPSPRSGTRTDRAAPRPSRLGRSPGLKRSITASDGEGGAEQLTNLIETDAAGSSRATLAGRLSTAPVA